MADSFSRLSEAERAQLGTHKILSTGRNSEYRYVPEDLWPTVRSHLLTQSRKAASRYLNGYELPERMTAYTPGETLHLLREPEVVSWHAAAPSFQIPEADALGRPIRTVALVPCAKTKPWDRCGIGLYAAYNAIRRRVERGETEPLYFVTISEPLGVVPQNRWGDFPMYDNPGLFACEVQRSGMFKKDWESLEGVGYKYVVPFDQNAYDRAIDVLAGVISSFVRAALERDPSLRFVSFVEDLHGKSTHSDMLDRANALVPFLDQGNRYPKKAKSRTSPEEHILSVLSQPSEAL